MTASEHQGQEARSIRSEGQRDSKEPDPYPRLASLVRRSRRQRVQLAIRFLRQNRPKGADPPLPRMLRGGRGGEVRLKLYLSMCLLGVRAPHDVFGTAYLWAEALGLPDFERKGARRVRDALQWLEDANLIRVERARGKNPRVYLLSQAGTGNPYRRPASSGVPYASIPVEFWSNGWILRMSAKAIAVMIVLLQYGHGRSPDEFFWMKDARRYRLSADTWSRGAEELERFGFVERRREVKGDELELRRKRNLFRLRLQRFQDLAPADED